MRLKILASLVALPLSAGANAANVYSACTYGGYSKNKPVTQLFILKGDALEDYYGEWTHEKNLAWEAKFAKEPGKVRWISGYSQTNLVGQFAGYAEANNQRGACFVATSKERALAWFGKMSREGGIDVERLRDWRPTKAGVLSVEDWSGRQSSVPVAELTEPEPAAPSPLQDATHAASEDAPVRSKKTNAQSDAEFEAAQAEYLRKLADQQQQVGDYNRALEELARTKEEQQLGAARALAAHRKELEAHAQSVRAQQLEYRKELARPAGVPNPIYRGFIGPTCDLARRSAVRGAGTTMGTRFKEVTTETSGGNCVVQGWWWNTGTGGASRQ